MDTAALLEREEFFAHALHENKSNMSNLDRVIGECLFYRSQNLLIEVSNSHGVVDWVVEAPILPSIGAHVARTILLVMLVLVSIRIPLEETAGDGVRKPSRRVFSVLLYQAVVLSARSPSLEVALGILPS